MGFKKGNNIGPRFQIGVSGNPAGRPRNLDKAIKGIPKEAREKVYCVLNHALMLPNVKEAQAYLEQQAGEFGQYGFLLQLAIKQLMSKNGWFTASDILDRLFGKPRQQAEIKMEGSASLNLTLADPAALAGLKKALATGAKPRDPENE